MVKKTTNQHVDKKIDGDARTNKIAANKNQTRIVSSSNETKNVSRQAMPAVLRVLVSVLFLMVFAGIFTWYILLRQNMGDIDKTWNFIQTKSILTVYSYIVVLLVMCVIAAITWRPFLSIGISFALSSVLMYINTQKMNYRDAPLLPEDFLMADQAGTIIQFIDVWSVIRLALGVALVIVGSSIVEYGARRIFGYGVFGREARRKAWWERHSLLPRLVWTSVALAGLLMLARPVLHYDDRTEKKDAEWLNEINFCRWNQTTDYANNGFIVSFLYNIGGFHETEPEGYSRDTIIEIEKKYKDGDKKYDSLIQAVDNVIVVLNESFIDPEILGEKYAHSGGDPVPNLHKILEKYPSGYMYSPGYGGGTANIEFEVLTSLSNYWAQTVPYVTSLSKLDYVPGLTKNAVSEGLVGTAIHAFNGEMYKRSKVYNRMGFGTFLDYNTMNYTEHENGDGFISDRSVYNEALDILRDEDERHIIMMATMQNHMPYDSANYKKFNFRPLDNTYGTHGFETYLETINHGDKYLGEFVAELDKLEERTVMLWFGDHAPAVLSDYIDSGDPGLVDLAHLTPYFIYANFDLDELYTEKEVEKMNAKAGFELEADGVDLPVVTPNCLSSELYEILDVKMPPLIKLSSEVCKETPILTSVYSKNDEIQEESEVLKDYRLVNYDILSGKRYWLDME